MDGELKDLAQAVGDRIGNRRLATAESCTAGEIAQALATAKHASVWLLGGIVAYHRDVKYKVLGVPRGPVVNHETAQRMAVAVGRLLGAEVAVSATGAAGPSGQDGAEPGTVFLGFVVDGRCDTERHLFAGEPEDVTHAAVAAALSGLRSRL
jgi:nicotinamide-nucleotide amidase